jgi:C4-dicarboxylate transporter, DctM subunit
MSEVLVGVIGVCVLMIVFMAGMELSFAMAIVGFLGFAYLKSPIIAVHLLAKDYADTFISYTFSVVPLFVLMGQVAFNSGLAGELYKTARKFVGHVPGGLALATVVGATIFKAITGSTVATAATMSSVAVPEMDKYGYGRKLSTGVVASVGTLGQLIPPSGSLIIFGILTEQSIGKLFLAGIAPGLLTAFLFLLIIIGWCTVDPSIGPVGPRSNWRERMRSLPQVIWPILIFIVTIGGLLAGFFTPTEAGSVGAFTVVVLTLLKGLNFRGLVKSLRESVQMGCMVLMLIAGSTILGHFVIITRIPAEIANWVTSLSIHPSLVIVMIIFIFLIGGSVIDDLAFMILATPIFYPIILKLGFDPVWFAMVIGVTLMIGVIIPPVAMSVFVVKQITGEKMSLVYKGVLPFIIGLVMVLLVLFIFPKFATFLPDLLMK